MFRVRDHNPAQIGRYASYLPNRSNQMTRSGQRRCYNYPLEGTWITRKMFFFGGSHLILAAPCKDIPGNLKFTKGRADRRFASKAEAHSGARIIAWGLIRKSTQSRRSCIRSLARVSQEGNSATVLVDWYFERGRRSLA